MGSILLEAKWIVGIGNSIPINPNFWPKVGSHVFWRIDISRVCNFVDQVASQWNSTLVMLLFAPLVTKSIVKKPPRLGIANKLIPRICHFSLESCKSICFSIVNAPMKEVELRYSSQMWVSF